MTKKKKQKKRTPTETSFLEEESFRELTPGDNIRGWIVKEFLGSGGFGEVWRVTKDGTEAALKYAKFKCRGKPNRTGDDSIDKEASIMQIIGHHNLNHYLRYIDQGTHNGHDFLVMELIAMDLKNLLDNYSDISGTNCRLSHALKIGIQMLHGIWELHSIGLLHRDLKEENLGVDNNLRKVICILDLNTARFFTTSQGLIKEPRAKPGICGTPMFLSFSRFQGRESGRVDDLWSWFYILCELIVGELPWNYKVERISNRKQRHLNMQMKTPHFPAHYLIESGPEQLYAIILHLESLNFESCPDYEFLAEMMSEALELNNADPNPQLIKQPTKVCPRL